MADPVTPARIRSFVALDLDPETRGRIAGLLADLRPVVPKVRWARAESLHVTVRFLGYASPAALVALQGPLAEAAARCPPAGALVHGLGTFPDRGSPRVIWLGIELPESVRTLQAACEQAAVRSGFPPEPRPFRAHLTLGRWAEPVRRPALPHVDLGRARLERLVLYRSDLRRGGSVYTPLAAFTLGAPTG